MKKHFRALFLLLAVAALSTVNISANTCGVTGGDVVCKPRCNPEVQVCPDPLAPPADDSDSEPVLSLDSLFSWFW